MNIIKNRKRTMREITIKRNKITNRKKDANLKKNVQHDRFRYRIKNLDVIHLQQKIKKLKEMKPENYMKYFENEYLKKQNEESTDVTINKIINKNDPLEKIKEKRKQFFSFDYISLK